MQRILKHFLIYSLAAFIGSIFAAETIAQRPKQKKSGKIRPGRRPGEKITRAARGERKQTKLKEGDMAPDFSLPRLNGKGDVLLSSFRGKKPVVLVFASYT